ncbi:hypothetical protein D1B33_17660 [Lysinibacillus yapensis]|uniref:Cdk activating kinase (CAK)/RNA polymerase II transcription initiation/nucleotide excision repair factor TFIIH/TFIIK, cyclin H subunit n=1 Tax=Ureibacillus yapensis TaxID=2304605 RepID=A0A396SHV2_9BACL|nr:hypothetical protein [Lysinibacillus yapensis]RHW31451.1 hypothetical protein D1B33_17660 [Lysinibacillus yapensis]
MNRRQLFKSTIRRAKRSLNIEQSLPKLQYGVLLSLVLWTAILFVSRFFVFPYYREVATYVAVGAFIGVLFYIWWKRMREKDAIHRLDSFYPHNELITALSFKEEESPLVNALVKKCEIETQSAFLRFKNRKKSFVKPKALIGIVLSVLAIGILSIFPSATQQEAHVFEREQKVVKDLEKEVAELKKKSDVPQIKKQLQELQQKLQEIEYSEEALREVVKKQKELKLQEQKLKEKEKLAHQESDQGQNGLTAEEQKQLKELSELQKELASTANGTQSALSKLGKPISFDLQNAIASELGSESTEDSGDENSSSSDEQSNSDKGNSQQGNTGSQTQGNNPSSQKGQGQGQGQKNGNGSQGQGSGPQGNGGGQGKGGSGGKGGNGAGQGQGGRDLLSIPERIEGGSETTTDGGPLGEGKAAGEQKGSVPVTKGTIKSYEEVIGEYKDSYMESSERMQLPKDLQEIVQSYFSSIESE